MMNSIFNFVNEVEKRMNDKGDMDMRSKNEIIEALDNNINYDGALYIVEDVIFLSDENTSKRYEIALDDIEWFEVHEGDIFEDFYVKVKTDELCVLIRSCEGFGLTTVFENPSDEQITILELEEEVAELEEVIEMLKNKIAKYVKVVENQDEIIRLQKEMLRCKVR